LSISRQISPRGEEIVSDTAVGGYALLIGVGECVEEQFSLPVTAKDVRLVHQTLVDPTLGAFAPDRTLLLHDKEATKEGILAGLKWLQEQSAADPTATAIVYYSGHGWLETESHRYFLIPHDFDPYDWQGTAIAAEELNASLAAIASQRLLAIFDCCHAAGMATGKGKAKELRMPPKTVSSAIPKGTIDSLQQGKGRVIFTSCRENERSWVRSDGEMSVYTFHLIEALQGAGSQVGATEVTVFDLANHLGKAVPETARSMQQEQTPRFEMLETERFAISLLQGGKGLPPAGWQPQPIAAVTPTQRVIASGDGAIAIGGNVSGGTIMTGSHNRVTNVSQKGKYNINTESFSGRIGDNYGSDDDE
jgi:hypothetical protein